MIAKKDKKIDKEIKTMKKVILFMVFLILSIAAMGETLQERYEKSYNASREEIYNQIAGIISERDKKISEIEEIKRKPSGFELSQVN